MKTSSSLIIILINFVFMSSCTQPEIQLPQKFEPFKPVLDYSSACQKADSILQKMTVDEKIQLISGYNFFFVKGVPSANLPNLYLSDATQGVHIRENLSGQLKKSTAFPAPIALAATWDPQLANQYAHCIGEECRAGDIAVLLGPGMNSYRIAQNGRNFEYFGEDPFLAARLIEQYVAGVQSTGTISTLKHFACNNSDWHRRTSNSVVDERTMHEIYLPAFKAGIDAGAMAVMTAYNPVNDEYAGQSKELIDGTLRGQLGFKWLVMTDWWSVWDPEKVIHSGQDLEMPGDMPWNLKGLCIHGDITLKNNAKRLLNEGKVTEAEIDRMARNVVATSLAMGLDKRPVLDTTLLEKFPQHAEVALQAAREAMVLLRNHENLLPLDKNSTNNILITGEYANKVARGGGSAEVLGYDEVTLTDALNSEFAGKVSFVENPTDEELSKADVVIATIGTFDHEGWNKPTNFPDSVNQSILQYASKTQKLIVVVYTGSGMEMDSWNDKTDALIFAWYPGQNGNTAIAEIISGKTNPSGKLPITIEKKFEDSPGYPYLPKGEGLYYGWEPDNELGKPIQDIIYKEGVFTGYRWYQEQKIEPLYWFGFGLSYTQFTFSKLKVKKSSDNSGMVNVEVLVSNTGKLAGTEVVQVYLSDIQASVERPEKELKAFARVTLQPGQTKKVLLNLSRNDFAFWDVATHDWKVEAGEFTIAVGNASNQIFLSKKIKID
jgi:beta-glucosidase